MEADIIHSDIVRHRCCSYCMKNINTGDKALFNEKDGDAARWICMSCLITLKNNMDIMDEQNND